MPFKGALGMKTPMEVWFSNILLGKINPDNLLVEH